MNVAVQQLLASFDGLRDADKHQAAAEILRRVALSVRGDVPEESLVAAADELFHALDLAEAARLAAQVDWDTLVKTSPPPQAWFDGDEPKPF